MIHLSRSKYFYELRQTRKRQRTEAHDDSGGDPETFDHNAHDDDDGLNAWYEKGEPAEMKGQVIEIVVDSGAGATVVPYDMSARDLPSNRNLKFATATGQRLVSGNDCYLEGVDMRGKALGFRGCRASVKGPLLSVGEMATRNFIGFYGDGGFIIPLDAPPVRRFLKEMKVYCRVATNQWTPVYRERNVYKIRMRVPGSEDGIDMSSPSDVDLEPIDGEVDMAEPPFQRHPQTE